MALVTIQRDPALPFEQVDDSLLIRASGVDDTPEALVHWVEYRFPDSPQIVHRSVHATLKRGLSLEAAQGEFGEAAAPVDYDAWANVLLDHLLEERARLGHPVEFSARFTRDESAALSRAMAKRNIQGSLTLES